MRAGLLLSWRELGAKYWLVPSVMALGSIGLAAAAIAIDGRWGRGLSEALPLLTANDPDGARVILSTIAGSMITVAGVTFSITTATVATTASSFGPRLVTNFMTDRGNQLTLGTFIATFVFCLLVLRTVRGESGSEAAFVPHVSIFCSLLLALASLGVLIYFIHHVPESIHVSNILAGIGRQLEAKIDEHFREDLEGEQDPEHEPLPDLPEEGFTVRAPRSGYVELVDEEGLVELAQAHDLTVHLVRRAGDFVPRGDPLMVVVPGEHAAERLERELRDTFAIGRFRSQEQDVLLLVDRLVEVVVRALSPGVNDLFTALGGIDWLGGALARLARRRDPRTCRRDGGGRLRLACSTLSFEHFADAALDRLRPYVARDANASVHLMRTISRIAAVTSSPSRRRVLLRHAQALRASCEAELPHARDHQRLEAVHAVVLESLDDGAGTNLRPGGPGAAPVLGGEEAGDVPAPSGAGSEQGS